MGELVYKLIDNSVDPDCPTDEFQLCVLRVLKDKMVLVKIRESVTSDATS